MRFILVVPIMFSFTALSGYVLASDTNTPALSKLVITNTPSKTSIQIDTKTADQASWPKVKDTTEYMARTSSFSPAVAGESYKEYRALSAEASSIVIDEELRVWSWNDGSDVTGGGGDAAHQSRNIGGQLASAIPTSGTANFNNGDFRGTSKTWNWTEPSNQPNQTVAANNTWSVADTAKGIDDYGSGDITGSLTPLTRNAMDKNNYHQDVSATNPADPNYVEAFIPQTISLNGMLNTKTVASVSSYDGEYAGEATFAPGSGWTTSGTQNVLSGGLFGNGAVTSTSNVYSFLAMESAPIGGSEAINNDARGFISESGVFHVQ